MLLTIDPEISEEQRQEIVGRLQTDGAVVFAHQRHIAAIGATPDDCAWLVDSPLVEHIAPFTHPFKLVSREFKTVRTIVEVGAARIGAGPVTVIAGPCAVESAQQMHEAAAGVSAAGAHILRGGAFKPRSSPYSFQGLGVEGLGYLKEAAQAHGMAAVTEVMDQRDLPIILEHVDMLQVGSRNMQNITLLKALGRVDKPVLLKRGMAATYEDLLMAAEYILSEGNPHVVLCERGIRTFDHYARNTLDLAAVPILQELSHLPVIVDPSHGTGMARLVPPLTQAAVAVGADGVMIEVHPNPSHSVSDARQALSLAEFEAVAASIREFCALGAG